MTEKQMISTLKGLTFGTVVGSKGVEALEMAIKALEQNESAEEWYKLFVEKLDEQEPKADKPMCDRNICLNNEYNGIGCDECIVNNAEQEPCDDAISREDAIAEMEELNAVSFYEANEHSKEAYYEIKNMIKTIPSVTHKSGHWIETEYHRWRCSVCREKGMSEWDNIHNVRTNFCPDCGAKMVEPQESEE